MTGFQRPTTLKKLSLSAFWIWKMYASVSEIPIIDNSTLKFILFKYIYIDKLMQQLNLLDLIATKLMWTNNVNDNCIIIKINIHVGIVDDHKIK